MPEKKKPKKDKMPGVEDDEKINKAKADDFHDQMSSLIDSLASDEENGEAVEENSPDRPESEKSEIERGVAEVFDTFEEEFRPDERARKVIQTPLDIDIQIEEEDAAESEESGIEKGVAALFEKYEAASETDERQQQLVETIVNIEIEDADRDAGRNDEPKPSRVIYVAVGLFFVLVALIVAKLFTPPGDFDKNMPAKPADAYKIDRPSKKNLTTKIMPLKTEDRKNAETDVLNKFAPSDGTSEKLQETAKTGEAEDPMPEIHAFLMRWKTAWENTAGSQGDTDAYLSFYSDGFKSKGIDKSGWGEEKTQTNRIKQWIRIALTDINIAEIFPDGRVRVSFLQDYRSSNFSEKSTKILILRKEKNGWAIVGAEDSSSDDGLKAPGSSAQSAPTSNGQHSYPYTIHVASYRDRSVSNAAVDALRRDGFLAFASYAEIQEKGAWYRIFVNYYETLEEARRAALMLSHKETAYADTVAKPYAIQVGIFDSESDLKKTESGLRAKGYTSYRVPDEAHKDRTKVCVGAYDSIKDAAAEKNNLQNDHFSTIVIKR